MSIPRINYRGAALVTLIIAIVIFGTLALAVHAFLSQNIASGVVMLDRARVLYLAEAGTSDSLGYALFTSDAKDVTFMSSLGIDGDMYVNGNVTVWKPTRIRENRR